MDVQCVGGNVPGGFLGRRTYDRYILPFEREYIEFVQQNGTPAMYHNCGQVMNLVESYVDLGVRVVEPFSPPPLGDADLARVKALVAGRYVILSGIDQVNVLQNGSIDQVSGRPSRPSWPANRAAVSSSSRSISSNTARRSRTSRPTCRRPWNTRRIDRTPGESPKIAAFRIRCSLLRPLSARGIPCRTSCSSPPESAATRLLSMSPVDYVIVVHLFRRRAWASASI